MTPAAVDLKKKPPLVRDREVLEMTAITAKSLPATADRV